MISSYTVFPGGPAQFATKLKPMNPVYMVKKMARPEDLAAVGYHLQHLREGVRASLLTNIYQHMLPHLSEEDLNQFSLFYKEMLIGMDAQARESGAQPKTVNQLREFIEWKELPDSIETICLTLVRLMDPPEPFDL